MSSRAKPALARAAALGFALGATACHELETVGVLPADGSTLGTSTTGGDGSAQSGADGGGGFVVRIDECLAGNGTGLDAETIGALLQGSEGAQASVRWLYPYDGTVFPTGLEAPLLMWSDGGVAEDAVYVHLYSSSFDYRGCMKPAAAGQLQLSQRAWSIAGAGTAGADDPFTLEVTVLAGGRVLGPATEQILVAAGSLPGAVEYMTTGSKLGVGPGLIIRAQALQSPRLVFGGAGCYGCHTISAGGTRSLAYANGIGTAFSVDPSGSGSPAFLSTAAGAESAALTPDGTLYVPSAHPTGIGPKGYGAGVASAGLYETATGALLGGGGIPTGAMTPAFSPDGTQLAFNDFAIGGGKGLALMSFSVSARTASSYSGLYTATTGYPAWPSFLPDGKALVFQIGSNTDFTGGGAGVSGGASQIAQGDLYLVDTGTHAATILSRAMGFAASGGDGSPGAMYLPFGPADAHQNYDPAVFPSPSGGYAWVLFDSMRHYGNMGTLRQIWVTALDVSPGGTYATDPSHPPFLLPGQEIGTGNFRPIAAPVP
jgi:hypothetical protein